MPRDQVGQNGQGEGGELWSLGIRAEDKERTGECWFSS